MAAIRAVRKIDVKLVSHTVARTERTDDLVQSGGESTWMKSLDGNEVSMATMVEVVWSRSMGPPTITSTPH